MSIVCRDSSLGLLLRVRIFTKVTDAKVVLQPQTCNSANLHYNQHLRIVWHYNSTATLCRLFKKDFAHTHSYTNDYIAGYIRLYVHKILNNAWCMLADYNYHSDR